MGAISYSVTARERAILKPYAMSSALSAGREHPEPEHRTAERAEVVDVLQLARQLRSSRSHGPRRRRLTHLQHPLLHPAAADQHQGGTGPMMAPSAKCITVTQTGGAFFACTSSRVNGQTERTVTRPMPKAHPIR